MFNSKPSRPYTNCLVRLHNSVVKSFSTLRFAKTFAGGVGGGSQLVKIFNAEGTVTFIYFPKKCKQM